MSEEPCVHEWCDLYSGSGTDKDDPEIALVTFFCKKCLEIRIKPYSQKQFKLNPEYLEEFGAS